jgi:cellulose synthase/poly-beta-1,6-N-acetylglucosamine synthase-like glycosyltransferase
MLVESVESVRSQSVAARELFVCIDHNESLAARCRSTWNEPSDDLQPPIVILENQYEGRLGSARNTAVERATGDIVAFLDDDASADRDWLKHLTNPYQRSDVVAVGGAPLPVYETARPDWFPPQLDWVFGCYYEGLPSELAPVDRLIGASMSARRDALAEIGGFHSDNHDDMDMCLRLAFTRPDQLILIEPQAVVHHRVVAERVTWGYLWRRCFYINKGKVKAFRDMGSAATMEADFQFVIKALRRSMAECVHDLKRGDLNGFMRFGVLVISIGLAAAGNLAGRASGK